MLDMVECSLACTLKLQLVEPQLYFAQWTSQLALDAFALSVWQTSFLLFFAKSHDFQEGHCLEVPSGQPYPLHHCVIQRCCLTVSNSSILNNLLFLSHCSISFFYQKVCTSRNKHCLINKHISDTMVCFSFFLFFLSTRFNEYMISGMFFFSFSWAILLTETTCKKWCAFFSLFFNEQMRKVPYRPKTEWHHWISLGNPAFLYSTDHFISLHLLTIWFSLIKEQMEQVSLANS